MLKNEAKISKRLLDSKLVVDIESRCGAEARVANVEQVVELVLRAFRVIP